MSLVQFKYIIGLAGVAKQENIKARYTAIFFDCSMLFIAFWLPIQWYLQATSNFPKDYVLLSDWIVWSAFFIESVVLVSMVKNKVRYLSGNWLNILILIMVFPYWLNHFSQFGAVRLIRLLVLFRIIVPWLHNAHYALTLNRMGLTLAVFLITTSLSGVFLSIIDPAVKNPFIGIWWAWETVTTVGYGDVIPVTPVGKVLAMVVMFMGIVLFSIVTATVSAFFVGKDQNEKIKDLLKRDSAKINAIEQYIQAHSLPAQLNSIAEIDHFLNQLTPEQLTQLTNRLEYKFKQKRA